MSHADRPDPESVVLANGKLAATAEQLLAALEALGVEHDTITHDPLYTVEQSKQVPFELPGVHTKNLFLRNKKGSMLLLVVEQDHTVDLRGLRDKLQMPGGHFAFASTERLSKFLGVVPGSVSPLALINDHGGKVQVYVQDSLLKHKFIYMHPCRNTHSTRISTDDLRRVLASWDHPVVELNFDEPPS